MDWSESLHLQADELESHRSFSLDRAGWHLRQSEQEDARDSERRRLLAATLMRDAAAVSIILGDFSAAIHQLRKAASLYLRDGRLYGIVLAAIAGEGNPWDAYSEALKPLEALLRENMSQRPAAAPQQPHWHLRQADLLSVLQAMTINPAGSKGKSFEREWERPLYRGLILAIEERRGAWDQDAPNALYQKALLQVARGIDRADTPSLGRLLAALAASREAELSAAQNDHFNWEQLPCPSKIVDFDLIALAMGIMSSGLQWKKVVSMFDSPEDAVGLPVEAARVLRDYWD
ncbi:MAG: hypothetical protein EOP84_23345 [Verrucomicrobiaceae bacterium]|nr:MAG: hypothetical protein EOP84_23345 [Verrucomicrobiaceae bacterium]